MVENKRFFISELFSFYDQTEQSYNLIKIRIQGKFHSSSVALNVVLPPLLGSIQLSRKLQYMSRRYEM